MSFMSSDLEPAGLENLAPELAVQIMQNLSITDVTSLLLASKRMREVLNANKPYVMSMILKEQPGIDEMLYLHTAQRCENHRDRMLHPRIVNVRYNGPSGPSTINLMGRDVAKFEYLSDKPLVLRTNVFTLSIGDVIEVWNKMKVIDRYVDLFPRVYWRESPEERRCLRPAEEVRLRKAVARWWLYSHHHHGFFHNWRSFQVPKKWDRDPRLVHIRRLNTDEILELQDLWEFVRDVVSNDLCSSPERICRCDDGYVVDLVPWGAEEGRHNTIVSTYMKLAPDQLMYYLDHYANWKRSVTVNAITADTRLFTRDTETLSISMMKVLEERMLVRSMQHTTFPICSIVDDTRDHPAFVNAWVNDRWADGRVPLDEDQIEMLPQDQSAHARRGDDGTDASLPH
ncbi:hypothetical protein GGR53DRAFT_141429 [Hypoxylon sp. FL1150]|nr:hypothetical protein GGR53DRAFT_141429 [Hypoxylon sp. FL1150]